MSWASLAGWTTRPSLLTWCPMFRIFSVFALFVAALALTGCKSKEQKEAETAAVKAEQDKLQGKWKFASRVGDEDEEDKDEEKPEPTSYLAYVIEGDILKEMYVDKDGKENVFVRYKMTITPDKDPKQVDLTEVDEAGKPVTATTRTKSKGKTKTTKTTFKNVAIYKVEGDKLTLCISFDDKKRPASFEPKKGDRAYAVNLEKMK